MVSLTRDCSRSCGYRMQHQYLRGVILNDWLSVASAIVNIVMSASDKPRADESRAFYPDAFTVSMIPESAYLTCHVVHPFVINI